MIYLEKMDYLYKIIAPDLKTVKEISTDKKITPQVGDFVCLNDINYMNVDAHSKQNASYSSRNSQVN